MPQTWCDLPAVLKNDFGRHIFAARIAKVELLTGREVGEFAHSGNARDDLLSITAVHPMRKDDVRRLLTDDLANRGFETMISEDEFLWTATL